MCIARTGELDKAVVIHFYAKSCQLRKMDSIAGLRGGVLSSIYRPWDPGPRRA